MEVKTETDIAQLLEAGNGHRAVAAHNLNDASSRSHAIFTLTLDQRRKPNAPADSKAPKFLKSKLHLVDLAGNAGPLTHDPNPLSHALQREYQGCQDCALGTTDSLLYTCITCTCEGVALVYMLCAVSLWHPAQCRKGGAGLQEA